MLDPTQVPSCKSVSPVPLHSKSFLPLFFSKSLINDQLLSKGFDVKISDFSKSARERMDQLYAVSYGPCTRLCYRYDDPQLRLLRLQDSTSDLTPRPGLDIHRLARSQPPEHTKITMLTAHLHFSYVDVRCQVSNSILIESVIFDSVRIADSMLVQVSVSGADLRDYSIAPTASSLIEADLKDGKLLGNLSSEQEWQFRSAHQTLSSGDGMRDWRGGY